MEGKDSDSADKSGGKKKSDFCGATGTLANLGDLDGVLSGSSSVVLDVELLHQFIKPAEKLPQSLFLLSSGNYNSSHFSTRHLKSTSLVN